MTSVICDLFENDGEEASQEKAAWNKNNRGALIPNTHRDLHKLRINRKKQDTWFRNNNQNDAVINRIINHLFFYSAKKKTNIGYKNQNARNSEIFLQ